MTTSSSSANQAYFLHLKTINSGVKSFTIITLDVPKLGGIRMSLSANGCSTLFPKSKNIVINLFFLFFTTLLIFFPPKVHCSQVTLAWDPVSASELAGYKIYYGFSSGTYQWVRDVGNVTTATLSSLTAGTTYYSAATAYNTSGIESHYSNEVKFTIPNCSYTISPSSISFPESGGPGTVIVTTQPSCGWTVSSGASWLTLRDTSGIGNGTIGYTVATNQTYNSRSATLTIAGQNFTIIQSDTIFSDLLSSDWEYNYALALYDNHITTGCSQNPLGYCPDDIVTRGQMAAFLIRSLYGENFTYSQVPYFNDVPTTNTFFKYVQKLKDLGLTAINETYGVDDQVTRGQMAAFIIRAVFGETFPYTPTPYYADVPADNIYFKYIQKLKDVGITTTTTGTYMVDDFVTRAQIAAYLARAFLGMQ
jgi:hypothetical protein